MNEILSIFDQLFDEKFEKLNCQLMTIILFPNVTLTQVNECEQFSLICAYTLLGN